jgi:flagellar basal-body rod modification protein FlgD
MTDAVTGTMTGSAYAPQTVTTGTSGKAIKQTMDSEVFMQLLVTQLQNQDPSSPMDTNEMMSQTTQLASMEQLTELTKASSESFGLQMRIAAANLIGQNVTYTGADGTAKTGVVSSVSYANSTPTVTIGDTTIALDAVSGVTAAGSTATTAS